MAQTPSEGVPAAVGLGPVGRGEWIAVGALTAVAAVLLLANLGDCLLWQDEAQTALIAKTVLTDGVPRGTDGRNFFSQEDGLEYGSNHLWRWHTWFPFYLLAGFYKVFGVTTFVSRLPFALLGVATVPLAYFFGRSLWQNRRAAMMAAVLLVLSVPFLILMRQCRYYSPVAFFSVLGLFAYHYMILRRRWAPAVYVAAAVLLFNSHYLYYGVLAATVLVHAAMFHRDRLWRVGLWTFATFLLNLPWMIWLFSPPAAGRYPDTPINLSTITEGLTWYLIQAAYYVFTPLLLVLLGVVAGVVRRREGKFPMPGRPAREGTVLLVLFSAITLCAAVVSTPFWFFRYLGPLLPVLAIVAGLILDFSMRLHAAAGLAGLVAAVVLNPLIIFWIDTFDPPWHAPLERCGLVPFPIYEYLYEITHHYEGPIDGIVEFLNRNARPDDIVLITYGDLPVKFYTSLRVTGGLAGEDVSLAPRARWLIIRRSLFGPKDLTRIRDIYRRIKSKEYWSNVLSVSDIPFQNRESPDLHRFRTSTDPHKVTVWEHRPPPSRPQ
jgi:hypothetical protein